MAQYDGRVLIDTEIQTKKAKAQLIALENRIVKTSDKIASLRSKMDSLKDAKIPTQEYKKLQLQLDATIKKYEELDDQVKTFQKIGMDTKSEPFRKAQDEAQELYMKIEDIRGAMFDLEESGKAFTLGSSTEEFTKLSHQLQYAENDLAVLNQQYKALELKQEKVTDGYKRLGNVAKKSFDSIGKVITKANNYINSFGKRIKEVFSKFTKYVSVATKSANGFKLTLKNILKYGFGIRSLYVLVNKIRSGIKEGFSNLYNDTGITAFKNQVDSLRASLLTLKNSFAAAFRPLVEVAIPYIQKLIDYMTVLMNKFSQFFAAITGQKTYTRAIKQTADAFKEEAEAVKETAKELEGYLSPLDEINKYATSKSDAEKDENKKIEEIKAPMFEEVPIDSYFFDLANKVKDIFSQLFAPLKEAWNREGKFVMDSWKYALKEVWDLIKSIGSDFLEVWQQEKTVKIFEDLLHIIGDIGLVIGNLAHNFRLAWEENETGKRILEGIRDIIGVIVANIRHAADATVEWSKNLNFSPLLTAIKGWIESLVPVFDNLSGIITDFYEKVLLPLGKWTIEKGLPELLQVFIDFNNKVDWEALRSRLAQFWEHLEPFAETVGEGLIIFIERCANALADFINSPAFDNFLTIIENWMDSVKPEDVADALEAIAKAIIALKVAVVAFSAISKGLTALSSLINILKFFGTGGGASKALSGLKSIGSAIAGWAPHIAVGIAIANVIKKIKEAVSERIDTSGFGLADWISESLKLSLEGWKSEFDNFKISLELWWQDTWMSNAIWNFGQWWNEKIKPWFTQERWSELWSNISETLSAKWQDVVNSWNETKEKLTNKWNEIKDNAIKIFNDVKQSLKDLWSNMKETAIQTWQFIRQSLTEKWNDLKSKAKTTFDNIKNSIKESIENIKTDIANIWSKVKENTLTAWNNIKEKAVSSIQTMAENIREKFSNLQEAIRSFSSIAQSIWSSAWEGMKNKVISILSSIQSTISSVFGWISNMINSLGNSLRNLASSIFSFGSSTKSTSSSASNKFARTFASESLYSTPAFANLDSIPIPKLATGAVIPANREFLAVLGDQKHGTNVEAPLDMIKQASEEGILNVLSKIGFSGGNMGGTPVNVTLQVLLDGSVIGQKMVDWGKLQQMATGSNPYELGTT